MNKINFWKRIVVVFFVALGVSVVVDRFWEWAFPNSSGRWDTTIIIAVILVFIALTRGRHGKNADCCKDDNSTSGLSQAEVVKDENLEKVLGMFNSRQDITNDDVEKSLGVSDATATRYLDRLEKDGKIIQIGKEGRGVVYKLK